MDIEWYLDLINYTGDKAVRQESGALDEAGL